MLTLLALTLVGAAQAGGNSPYMWGVGPEVGSIILPFQHPILWPRTVVGTDADGEEVKERLGGDSDSFDKTGGDILFGGKGALYLNKSNRFIGQIGFGLGGGNYRSAEGTAEYQFLPLSENGVDAFVGAGLGLGSMHWATLCPNDLETSCPDQVENPGELKFSTLLLRGSAGVMFRQPTRSYELSVFAHYVIAGNTRFTPQGSETDQDASLGLYPYLGLAGTIYFGDFKPPGEGGGKKKKNKNNDA